MATTATTLFPGLTLEAAFSTDALTSASVWTDVSVDLRGFGIQRGRSRETEPFQAGELRLVMNSRSRQWDPEYSAGPHFGALVPMLQVRLRDTYSAVTNPAFYGYVESLTQLYPGQDADAYCEITVIDGFSVLANAQLPDSVWEVEMKALGPSAWYRLGEKFGQVMGDASGNNRHGTYNAQIVSNQPGVLPYSGSDGALLFDGIDDAGFIPDTANPAVPYSIGFWAKTPATIPTDGTTAYVPLYRSTGSLTSPLDWTFYLDSSLSNWVFYNNEMGPTYFLNALWSDTPARPSQTYFVVATYSAGVPKLYINGVLQTLTAGGSGGGSAPMTGQPIIGGNNASFFKAWPGIIDEVFFFTSVLSAADVTTLYNAGTAPWSGDTSGGRVTNILDAIGWPASLRDLDAGESVLGPTTLGGNALNYLQTVATTEAGLFYMTADGKVRLVGRGNMLSDAAYSTSATTFGDGGGTEMKYNDITVEPSNAQQIINDVTVSRQGGIDQHYQDATSASKYGVRSTTFSGLLMAADGEAADRAIATVRRYKDPGFQVSSLRITPQRDAANLYPKVLLYELGQKLTVKRRPQALGTAITKDVRVEGIRHEAVAGAHAWTTEYLTAPIDPDEDNWCVVDAGVVGTNLAGY